MEIIDLINDLEKFRNKGFRECNVEKIILNLKKIENDKKVKIPSFVADWIEYCKKHNFTLFGCLDPENGFESLVNEIFEGDIRKCIRWCRKESNIFARAWLDGYEIEQEKRYLVKMKGISGYGHYLNKALSSGEYFFASENEVDGYKTKHTRKELENSGFGWVFNCPGTEVKEVKE